MTAAPVVLEKEMQILRDNFAPEFGRGFGAVVLVQTNSGGHQAHGEAYWYLQNSALNAGSFYADREQALRRLAR